VLDLAIFGVVNGVALLGVPIGVPAALTALFYALGRFAVEFSRNNQGRMIAGPFSLNHAICLAMAVAGAVTLHYAVQAAVAPPALSWPAAVAAAPALLPVFVLGALLVFLGFSMHRGRVGGW
jgi:prolipoprotein diacylglyceryltransferase